MYQGQEYLAKILCDIMHLEGAKPLAEYQEDFYAKTPVITRNDFGKGQAYYVGTSSEDGFYRKFTEDICKEQGIAAAAIVPEGVEAVRRVREKEEYLFLLNHSEEEKEISVPAPALDLIGQKEYNQGEILMLPAKGVGILKGQSSGRCVK